MCQLQTWATEIGALQTWATEIGEHSPFFCNAFLAEITFKKWQIMTWPLNYKKQRKENCDGTYKPWQCRSTKSHINKTADQSEKRCGEKIDASHSKCSAQIEVIL